MSRREQLLQALELHVHQDCNDYAALEALMQALYEQLMRRDCLRIEQSNRQISECLERLSAHATWRSKALAAFGLKADKASMARVFKQYPPARAAALAKAWQRLEALTQSCRALNERNGRLLAMHNDILAQLLAAEQAEPVYRSQYY